MVTSSNGNIFHVTGHLCGEFTGPRWFPRNKASDAELWYFFRSEAWLNGWVNNHEAGDLSRHRAHYDVTVMDVWSSQFRSRIYMVPALESLNFVWISSKQILWYHFCETCRQIIPIPVYHCFHKQWIRYKLQIKTIVKIHYLTRTVFRQPKKIIRVFN